MFGLSAMSKHGSKRSGRENPPSPIEAAPGEPKDIATEGRKRCQEPLIDGGGVWRGWSRRTGVLARRGAVRSIARPRTHARAQHTGKSPPAPPLSGESSPARPDSPIGAPARQTVEPLRGRHCYSFPGSTSSRFRSASQVSVAAGSARRSGRPPGNGHYSEPAGLCWSAQRPVNFDENRS